MALFSSAITFLTNPTFILSISLVTLAFIYNFIVKNWWYFNVRNAPFARGWPLLGCIDQMVLGKESFAMTIHRLYNRFPRDRFFGLFELTQPVFVIRDPDLLRVITVQQFDHFVNHQGDVIDPILGRTLFFLKDQKWKDMRAVLSPAFTGNKMRSMFDLIRESTGVFMQHISDETRKNAGESSEAVDVYELKDTFTRYTTDVIATCAFGLNMNSMLQRENEFYHTGKKLTNFDGIQGVKLLLFDCIPTLMRLLNINLFDSATANYFRNVVKTTIEHREKSQYYRPDLIHLLMKARQAAKSEGNATTAETYAKKSTIEWEDDDVVAQCLIFFFAGFETVSTLLCFMAHELALNQAIQNRLHREIVAIEAAGETLTYENLSRLTYMDMVIMETLRRWPPLPSTDRQVSKPFSMENSDGVRVTLHKGDPIWIPIYGLHTDAKHFPDPMKFDPERFSEENRENIVPGTYMPFGSGQRTCIAARFATMEAKTIFYHLLKSFRIERCDRTSDPMVLKKNTINMMAENGFWVKFTPRNDQLD